MRHHQQLPEDDEQIPDREGVSFMWLLGPLARLIYDQFTRMFIKLIKSRCSNVLWAMRWLKEDALERLVHLLIVAEDLLVGQFTEAG